jgi:hypothetical protein
LGSPIKVSELNSTFLHQLEELLRHDISLVPSVSTVPKDGQNSKQPRSRWQELIVATKTLLKGRAATNISLLMVRG